MLTKCGGFCCLYVEKCTVEADFYPQTAEKNINI